MLITGMVEQCRTNTGKQQDIMLRKLPQVMVLRLVMRQKRLFTAAEYERMIEAGVLTKDDRVELLAGEVVSMSPIGSPHAACVKRLSRLLFSALDRRATIGVQDAVVLAQSSAGLAGPADLATALAALAPGEAEAMLTALERMDESHAEQMLAARGGAHATVVRKNPDFELRLEVRIALLELELRAYETEQQLAGDPARMNRGLSWSIRRRFAGLLPIFSAPQRQGVIR